MPDPIIPPVDPPAPPPPPASPPPPPAAQTWFTSMEPEAIGHIQNRGWHLLDPTAAALEAVKAFRAAESKLGMPVDRILKKPTDGNVDETKAFWQSVGAPTDPKEYTFTGVDFGGEEATKTATEALRAAAAEKFMPKDFADHFAKTFAKLGADQRAQSAADAATRLQEERTKLEQDWGPPTGDKFKANMGIADRMAATLGITQELMDKLKDGIGGAEVARHFRNLADLTGEAKYVTDPANPRGGVMTREQAILRRFELSGIDGKGQMTGKPDQEWSKKLYDGDAAANKEWRELIHIIVGE